MSFLDDLRRIAELEAQVKRQSEGSEVTSALMKKMEEENERLRAALEKIANHKMDSIDKVYLIHQCEGFQKCASQALEGGE